MTATVQQEVSHITSNLNKVGKFVRGFKSEQDNPNASCSNRNAKPFCQCKDILCNYFYYGGGGLLSRMFNNDPTSQSDCTIGLVEKSSENYILSATLDQFLESRMKKQMTDQMLWTEKVALQ